MFLWYRLLITTLRSMSIAARWRLARATAIVAAVIVISLGIVSDSVSYLVHFHALHFDEVAIPSVGRESTDRTESAWLLDGVACAYLTYRCAGFPARMFVCGHGALTQWKPRQSVPLRCDPDYPFMAVADDGSWSNNAPISPRFFVRTYVACFMAVVFLYLSSWCFRRANAAKTSFAAPLVFPTPERAISLIAERSRLFFLTKLAAIAGLLCFFIAGFLSFGGLSQYLLDLAFPYVSIPTTISQTYQPGRKTSAVGKSYCMISEWKCGNSPLQSQSSCYLGAGNPGASAIAIPARCDPFRPRVVVSFDGSFDGLAGIRLAVAVVPGKIPFFLAITSFLFAFRWWIAACVADAKSKGRL